MDPNVIPVLLEARGSLRVAPHREIAELATLLAAAKLRCRLSAGFHGSIAGEPVGQLQERWNAVRAVHARHQRRRFPRADAHGVDVQRPLALAARHGRGPGVGLSGPSQT